MPAAPATARPARPSGYAPTAERVPHRFGSLPTGYVRQRRRAWPVAAVGRRVVELDERADERALQRVPERALHGVGCAPEVWRCPSLLLPSPGSGQRVGHGAQFTAGRAPVDHGRFPSFVTPYGDKRAASDYAAASGDGDPPIRATGGSVCPIDAGHGSPLRRNSV